MKALRLLAIFFASAQVPLLAATNVEHFQENPVAQLPTPAPSAKTRVVIDFDGATHYTEPVLRGAIADQISAIETSGLSSASADDAAFFLSIFYRKNGYSQAEVKWEIRGSNRLRLKTSEGPLTTVDQVRITGNRFFPEPVLREYLLGATRERFPRARAALPFVEGDIETGVERIGGLYQAEGFLDSTIDPPEFKYSRDGRSGSVVVTIHEGTQYHFGKITFGGDLVFFPQTPLLNELKPFLEKPYTRLQVSNMQRKVIHFYKSRGYFQVKVEVVSEPEQDRNGIVPVAFHVESGNIFRFDGVSVTGLDRLRPGFLPNRFAKLRHKFYDPAKLDAVYQEMMRTGLFKNLRVTSKALSSNEVELDLDVEEAKAKEIGFSIGYGTFEGAILGLHLGDRDLFGTGRPLALNIEASQRLLKGELLLIDPWFLESDLSLRLRLYALTQDFDGYSKLETGFRAELSRKFAKKLELTLFTITREVEITSAGIDPLELGATNYFVSGLGLAATLDLRDSPINPRKGFVLNGTVDSATQFLGSSIEFVRGTFRLSYYLPIKKSLLAFGARAGIIQPFGSSAEIPIDERFFNGGSRSVRSFAERELGPKDINNFPIGGETFSTFNVEYNVPVVGDLDLAVFADAGSVGESAGSGLGLMRYGVGAGIRYRLPVGPLRLDYGFNPSRRAGESTGAFHFSFGFAF
jgi:outer membrane protein insertion porin family